MPFGLCNAPVVFQRLMQQVLQGVNPPEGLDFMSVYTDDVLVFLNTLEEHFDHLQLVIQCIQEAGLKLKLCKCRFTQKEVEYLGHIITPDGIKPNRNLAAAVKEFPVPKNVRELRRFLGMTSYYREVCKGHPSIAPLD